MPDPDELARILRVLSVGTRVRIIQLLKGRALCVNALAARLDVTQGAVSQHLRILRDSGWVTAEKRGYFVHYRLNPDALAHCRALVEELLQVPDAPGCSPAGGVSKSVPEKNVAERSEPCAKKPKAARGRKN
ncbi:MAG TPA: ArsR family transcriptional regulator [Planctomycetaceae bacterium]|nr:ArsR family transcriptional regulator [Planctomycetaceae bacterium]HIQ20591.1 ArsR family transcriptional regulator [Planctomycetota bacterium]